MQNDLGLSIIIVNHKCAELTQACIQSLREFISTNAEIIVIDNSPEDETLKIENKQANLKILRLDSNLGFAQAVNSAFESICNSTVPKYILLLNPDTYCDSDFISPLIDTLESNNDYCAVSPLILKPDNSIWYAGGFVSSLKGGPIHSKTINKNQEKQFYETDFLSACAMLIKTDVFKELGGLPEEYFLYFEDAEFSVKLKKLGYSVACVANSRIFHHVSKSTDPKSLRYIWLYGRNRIWFMKRNFSAVHFLCFVILHFCIRFPAAVIYFLLKEQSLKKPLYFLKGSLTGLLTSPIKGQANLPPF